MAYTIDPANKRIVLDSANVTVKIYLCCMGRLAAIGDNAKYLPAFSAVGGDDLGGGIFILPTTFCLTAGVYDLWRQTRPSLLLVIFSWMAAVTPIVHTPWHIQCSGQMVCTCAGSDCFYVWRCWSYC